MRTWSLGALLLACSCAGSTVPFNGTPCAAPPAATAAPSAKPMVSHEAMARGQATKRPLPVASEETRRLARLAKLWGHIRYLHPYSFEPERKVDWDGALVRAISGVRSAVDEDAEAAALSTMLSELSDPLTRIVSDVGVASTASPGISLREQAGATVLKLAPRTGDEAWSAGRNWTEKVAAARLLVVDLRVPDDDDSLHFARVAMGQLERSIVSHDATSTALRMVAHHGFVDPAGPLDGEYSTASVEVLPRLFHPRRDTRHQRVAFIVNRAIGVPEIATAMQNAGDALVIAQGVGVDPAAGRVATVRWGHHRALLREADALEEFRPDVIAADSQGLEGEQAIDAAIHSLGSAPRRPPVARTKSAPPMRWSPDDAYANEASPSLEYRLLGLFRFWNAIELFYPFKSALDETWDDVLAEFIPQFLAASDQRGYELAVRELATRLQDSHVAVQGGHFAEIFGDGVLPFSILPVEGKPTVSFVPDERGRKAGVVVGDVIVSIDGESFDSYAEHNGRYVTASTEAGRTRAVDEYSQLCHRGKPVVVRLTGASGAPRDVSVDCGDGYDEPHAGSVFRKIGDIGYVDLDRLENSDVVAMFEAFRDTRGIIFDMRGYPHGTVKTICPRLNIHPGPVAWSRTSTAVVRPGTDGEVNRIELESNLIWPLPPGATTWRGKTMMLVDTRTQSQAESTALCFEAANGTRFVGTPTAGADGAVTSTCLPGGLCIRFTGSEMQHADGRPLQRVGIQPDIPVAPTLRGLRAGVDEVLERAIHELQKETR